DRRRAPLALRDGNTLEGWPHAQSPDDGGQGQLRESAHAGGRERESARPSRTGTGQNPLAGAAQGAVELRPAEGRARAAQALHRLKRCQEPFSVLRKGSRNRFLSSGTVFCPPADRSGVMALNSALFGDLPGLQVVHGTAIASRSGRCDLPCAESRELSSSNLR